jgi:hypothetical protein
LESSLLSIILKNVRTDYQTSIIQLFSEKMRKNEKPRNGIFYVVKAGNSYAQSFDELLGIYYA